ncbi:MAG: glutamate--tRNA ligase [Candidatus Gygaella obscura]|nr:glutamate--tRNA ligase [Candidatus Gygaella obscura]
MIRVRFAPSPTGNLHIGGARTALFNWLFARSKGAEFILRIEDTDIKRSQKEYIDEILNSLKWLGLDWDDIYYQSKNFDKYTEFAQKLVKENKAYKEEGAIIFNVLSKKIRIKDLVHGDIEFDAGILKPQVLIKADGSPTYNFACVVDDATQEITHIIRGDDHISNTPKQILFYEALGFSIPVFAHLPLILATEGGRMSKRKGATSISEYKALGYLPQALVNYLLLLGWSPGENQEIITFEQAIKKFNIEKANKTAAAFDINKLDWINAEYIKNTSLDNLLNMLNPFLNQRNYEIKNFDRQYLLNLIKLYQGRISKLIDFVDWADFFFKKDLVIPDELKKKHFSKDLKKEFALLVDRISALDSFTIESIEESFRALVKELGIKTKELVHPVRVALTGKEIGPGLFETMFYLGKEKLLNRLNSIAQVQK